MVSGVFEWISLVPLPFLRSPEVSERFSVLLHRNLSWKYFELIKLHWKCSNLFTEIIKSMHEISTLVDVPWVEVWSSENLISHLISFEFDSVGTRNLILIRVIARNNSLNALSRSHWCGFESHFVFCTASTMCTIHFCTERAARNNYRKFFAAKPFSHLTLLRKDILREKEV